MPDKRVSPPLSNPSPTISGINPCSLGSHSSSPLWLETQKKKHNMSALLLMLLLLGAHTTLGQVWVTYPDRSKLLAEEDLAFDDDDPAVPSIVMVDETQTFQTIEGFGAALTDSAAWLLSTQISEVQRNEVMTRLFGRDEGAAGISFVRIPLSSTDLSPTPYTYDDGDADPSLERFKVPNSVSDYTLPLAQLAQRTAQTITFLGSPWSAPAWMKTSNNLYSGKLQERYFPVYAAYFRKIVDAFAALNVKLAYVTVQNEPRYEPNTYPGMLWEWYDELNFVRGYLAAALDGTGVSILTFDHNWDLSWYPLAVMREGTQFYAGSAWHCYAGNASAMTLMHDFYPTKDIFFTECTQILSQTNFGDNMRSLVGDLFIASLRNWARSVLLWSLAMDPNGDPHSGGCANCRGVVTIEQGGFGTVTYNEEFYAIAHFGRFLRSGDRRIGFVDSSDGRFTGVAFKRTDGTKVAVVLNKGTSEAGFRLVDKSGNSAYRRRSLPASGVATIVWK